jgi:molybdenum cofactor biosynthesis enzyme MoaA
MLNSIQYHVLGKCNLSCKGCGTFSDHIELNDEKPHESFEKDLKIIQERFPPEKFVITGGEPLLKKDIRELVHTALTLLPNSNIQFHTNGYLLEENHKWLAELVNQNRRFVLAVSCHWNPKYQSKYSKKLVSGLSSLIDLLELDVLYDFKSDENYIKTAIEQAIHDKVSMIGLRSNMHICTWPVETWIVKETDEHNIPVQLNNDFKQAHASCPCPHPRLKSNGKLTKCDYTQHLKELLQKKGKLDEWPLLADYTDYDLYAEHDQDKWKQLLGPESVCSYCPVQFTAQSVKQDERSKIIVSTTN